LVARLFLILYPWLPVIVSSASLLRSRSIPSPLTNIFFHLCIFPFGPSFPIGRIAPHFVAAPGLVNCNVFFRRLYSIWLQMWPFRNALSRLSFLLFGRISPRFLPLYGEAFFVLGTVDRVFLWAGASGSFPLYAQCLLPSLSCYRFDKHFLRFPCPS